MPHVALGLLTVLAVGAIVLSLTQAPPVADTLLHTAAGATDQASSVAVGESIAQVVDGRTNVLDSIEVRLEPPGRLEYRQGPEEELVVAGRVYVSDNEGRTWYADTAAHTSVPAVTSQLLSPLRLLRHVTGARTSNGQTAFSFTTTSTRLIEALHLNLPTAGPTPVPVAVTVQGEFVTGFVAHLSVSGDHFVLTERYSHVDRLPTLVAPAVSPTP